MITLARSIPAVDKAHSLVSVFSVLKGLLQKSVKLVKSHSDRSLRFIALAGNKVSWIWAEIGVESCFNRKRTHQTTIIMKRDISTIFITPTLAFEACTCHTWKLIEQHIRWTLVETGNVKAIKAWPKLISEPNCLATSISHLRKISSTGEPYCLLRKRERYITAFVV